MTNGIKDRAGQNGYFKKVSDFLFFFKEVFMVKDDSAVTQGDVHND